MSSDELRIMLFAPDFKQTPPLKKMSDNGQSSASIELVPRWASHSGREQQEEKHTCVFTPTFGSFSIISALRVRRQHVREVIHLGNQAGVKSWNMDARRRWRLIIKLELSFIVECLEQLPRMMSLASLFGNS